MEGDNEDNEDSDDNYDIGSNDAIIKEETTDLEKMSEDHRVQVEYDTKQLKHSLAMKGLNLNYELNTNPNHLLKIENIMFK